MVARLGSRQQAALDQLADRRIVVRHAIDAAVAQQVDAAVADAGGVGLAVADGDRDAGRAHPGEPLLGGRGREDRPVGLLKRGDEGGVGRAFVGVVGTVHGVDGQLGGHLAGRVAAHPVRDDRQHAAAALLGRVAGLDDAAPILVQLADAADVADPARNVPRHRCLRRASFLKSGAGVVS